MRIQTIAVIATSALIAAGCGKDETNQTTAPAVAPSVASANDAANAAILASAAAAARTASEPASMVQATTPAEPDEPASSPSNEGDNSHNYAIEQDGEYGYKPGLSDQDRNQGTVTKPLVMIRYRGKMRGAYTVDMVSPSSMTLRLDCSDPCEYIRMRSMIRGQVLETKTMENDPDSLGHEVFEDAMGGKLQVYGKKG